MTMKHTVFNITVILFLFSATVQAQSPGGVAGPVKWATGKDNGTVQLSGTGGMTFVGVGRIQQGSEQLLWNVSTRSGKTGRVQTTARSANLARGTFMNYTGRDTLPQLRLYSYSCSSADGTQGTLSIGKMTGEKLPVRNLRDGMVEYAVYDRVLTTTERMRVESALALRHGITLAHSYFNSRGEIIRNHYRLRAYNHRIAGIIGDAVSKLDQTTGESSEEEAVIRVSTRSVSEGTSFLWGDDARLLSFAADKGNGKWMQRRWAASMVGSQTEPLALTFDTRCIRSLKPLETGEEYYLAVDESGTGRFPVGQIRYYRARDSHADSIVFDGIAAAAGESIFTLRIAKDFFATVETERPCCSTAERGRLRILLTGGSAPYRVTVSLDGTIISSLSTEDSILTVKDLQQGLYVLTARDRNGKTLSSEIMVSNADMADMPELQDVQFSKGASREYHLETQGNYTCRWKTPEGRYLSGESVTLDGDGRYLLELTDGEGCTTIRTLDVSTAAGDIFSRYDVSPNPTEDGDVSVRVEMSGSFPLELRLYSPDGALMQTQKRTADTYHATRFYLPLNGIYILEMKSGTSRKSIRLVRK